MQISTLTFLFKLSWGWQKGSESGLSLQRQFGEAQLGDTFEGCDSHKCWASPLFQSDALPVGSSWVLRIISHLGNGRLLKQEIQFTLTCQLRGGPPWTWIQQHVCMWTEPLGQCLVDLSIFILGIHTVPLSSQYCFVCKEEERQGA